MMIATSMVSKVVILLQTIIHKTMRKITQEAVHCFYNAVPFNKANTSVEVLPNVTILRLHGNPIAYRYNDPERTLSITNAGWFSNTTKERLNALDGVRIRQKDGQWYLNGELWNGELIDIEQTPNKGDH